MKKTKILVVEDEGITAMRIQGILEKKGYVVTSMAFSGEEAVKSAEEERPDLVLMDIVLGGEMDGIEAAGQIHSRFNIPAVYLTAYSDEEMLNRVKKTDPFGYIVKPFNDRELHIAIEIALYRHEMEVKLRKSETRFRTLFKNATDAIYIIDPKTERIIDCNRKAAKIMGYTIKQLKMMKVTELHPAEEEGVVSKIFQKVSKIGSLSGISEINQLTRDGRRVPVEINAAAIEINGKRCNLAITRDITERKKKEDALRDEKNRLVGILDNMGDGVYIVNEKNDIEYINPALRKKSGPSVGRKCYKYFHDRKTVCPWCRNKEVFAGKALHREWFSAEGKKTYDVFSTPLANPDGTVSSLNILHDITGHKQMEEKLQSASITDDLTGLFNRRGFFMLFEQHRKLSDRSRKKMSLLYADLDGMKTINDELGHKEGDNALIDTADILKRSFRESDIIARIGGDEFAVLLTEPSETDIENVVANHIQNKLKEFNTMANRSYELILSMGMAHYDPDRLCSIDELLAHADSLMYEDKKNRKILQKKWRLLKRKAEKRIYARYMTGGCCWVEVAGSGRVKIKDISRGGICLKTPGQLAAGSIYKIKILSTNNKQITAAGLAVWSSPAGKETAEGNSLPQHESGLEFIEMEDGLQSSLKRFIAELRN